MQKDTGNPNLSPELKTAMNLTGSLLLTLGVRQMAGISELGRLANPYRETLDDQQPTLKQRVGEALFNVSMGLLFAAQDGGGGGTSLANEHRKAGHGQIDILLEEGYYSPEEAQEKKNDYDRKHGW
jgi:hypothetical protein